eukprot:483913-Pyramimonas_sp.AAC.1
MKDFSRRIGSARAPPRRRTQAADLLVSQVQNAEATLEIPRESSHLTRNAQLIIVKLSDIPSDDY